MIIAHNMPALNTYKSMGIASKGSQKSMEKLSSGYRINRAGDDAAGLSISEKMRAQVRGLNQASRNSQDGISMIQTAEGALNESHAILQRMREIAVQSATDTNTDVDREALQNEVNQLTSEINRIGNTTEFNEMTLLDGSKSSTAKVVSTEGGQYAKTTEAVDFTHAAPLTSEGTLKFNKDGFKIDTDTTDTEATWAKTRGSQNVQITIEKVDDKIVVKSSDKILFGDAAADGTGEALELNIDEDIIANDAGDFVYNNHGITFTIDKENFELAKDGDKLTYDLNEVTAGIDENDTLEVKIDPAINVGGPSLTGDKNLTIEDFELNYGSDPIIDPASIKIEVDHENADLSKGTLSVKVLAKDVNGNDIINDEITYNVADADGGELANYESHGLKFAVYGADKAGGDFKAGSSEITFEIPDMDNIQHDKFEQTSVAEKSTIEDNRAYFHVGANANQTIDMSFGDMRADALGIVGTAGSEGFSKINNVSDGTNSTATEAALDVSTREGANDAITKISNAIQKVSDERSKMGAVQNRLEYTINNLNTAAENMQASESRIRDVDMAKEMMEMTKNNILQQAAQSMLVQANQTPQQALQLLR